MNRPAPALSRAGLAYALAAYGLWGVIPIYFKQIAHVPAIDIVAHRILWSPVVLAVLMTIAGVWGELRSALSRGSTALLLLLTAVLIGINWLLYVYAINSGQILAGSLGYYLNPIANIILGRVVLHEKLSRTQWLAVAIAGAGVAVLAAGALGTLWLSLTLCMTFATYGLLRKMISVDSLAGLSAETMILLPIALGWLVLAGGAEEVVAAGPELTTLMLIGTGLVSTVPLLCFTAAARRLPYSTLGMVQFVAPTLQFLVAVLIYGERLTRAHVVAFTCIWIALALYVASLVRARGDPRDMAEA